MGLGLGKTENLQTQMQAIELNKENDEAEFLENFLSR